jgi:hypothetical protein
MKRYCETTVGEGETKIVLPFCFDISSITMTHDDEVNYLSEYRDDLRIRKIKSNLADFLRDVDLELFSFDEDENKDFLEELESKNIRFKKTKGEYTLESSEDLYSLLNEIGYSECDFVKINDFVMDNRSDMVNKFINAISDDLKVGDKTGKVTESFMTMRGAMEHSSSCIFPENIGKSVSEYSWRENIVKRLYLARKVEVEEYYSEKAKAEAKKR